MWTVSVFRYGAGIMDWTIEELKKIDKKWRKMIIMHGAFHSKSDIDRLYLTREIGRRGLRTRMDWL